jgi:hypothetical protein
MCANSEPFPDCLLVDKIRVSELSHADMSPQNLTTCLLYFLHAQAKNQQFQFKVKMSELYRRMLVEDIDIPNNFPPVSRIQLTHKHMCGWVSESLFVVDPSGAESMSTKICARLSRVTLVEHKLKDISSLTKVNKNVNEVVTNKSTFVSSPAFFVHRNCCYK